VRHRGAAKGRAGRIIVVAFPEPTDAAPSRAAVLVRYLDYFREQVITKTESLDGAAARSSLLPSGWTPVELVRHLTFVELRWLVWGFEGRAVAEPWGDRRDDRWYVAPDEPVAALLAHLREQGERTRAIVAAHELDEVGVPGPRWDGAPPASLERILLHLLQEYARHLGHLDIVAELGAGLRGE
jgi:hypothetical protein